ncbi:ribonuclease P 40kDa subunit-domain-containing protein [Podospora didyma]|uniref:Ribonuclease P 40kDa subunit-domain-containing protein n=1 Tax=Podospora didyma TaxID=330526 RepID=A0AAE0U4S4_9PEZI|nr:ribonuclease P 40kDa subunit-domain-containing protein [Podospora didyma]
MSGLQKNMLAFPTPSMFQASKCFVTYGAMGHLDPKQPPSKRKPWTTLTGQDFVHRVDLILPQEAYDAVYAKLVSDRPAPEFKRVVMSLHDILSGDFFAEYIKKGNINMLSEGRRGIDNVFCLKNGVLTMFLDKEAYERAGLVGKPHGVKGKRGMKPRWTVEFDLMGSSMFPGKKGFDRLIYASKNAFNTPITWLFCNISPTTPEPDPLASHFPVKYMCNPKVTQDIAVTIPNLSSFDTALCESDDDFESLSTEIYEWLSLVRLQSPRIDPGDQINPYLCRYQVPGDETGEHVGKACKLSWQGFLPTAWSRQTLIDIIAALPPKRWFSFSTTTFSKGMVGDNSECTILLPSAVEYIMWEVKPHE